MIAKAGKPLVNVSALTAPGDKHPSRIGFMAGKVDIPDDFDRLGDETVDGMFNRP